MTAILDHLDQVSVFGPSSLALFLILGLDWVFSSVHTYEECRGEEAPLWLVFWRGRWTLATQSARVLVIHSGADAPSMVRGAGGHWWLASFCWPYVAAYRGWRAGGRDRGADIRYLGISLGPVSSGLSSKSGS